jgi:predicted transcriptional regulator
MNVYGSDVNKFNSSRVDRDITSIVSGLRLGDVEYKVLSFIVNNILPNRRSFRNEDVWKPLGLNRKRASEVLKQLSEKGFLKKIAWGFYEVSEKIIDFMSNMFKVRKISEGKRNKKNNNNNNDRSSRRKVDRDTPRTNPPHRVFSDLYSYGFGVKGSSGGFYLFLDNVRGVSVSGNYVYGDRGRRLSFIDVSLGLDRIDYAEFGVKRVVDSVSDSLLPGVFVFYSNPVVGEVYFEFRPYSGVVPRDERGSLDLGSGLRLMWGFFFRVFVELHRLLSSKRAPSWVRKMVDVYLSHMCRDVCGGVR